MSLTYVSKLTLTVHWPDDIGQWENEFSLDWTFWCNPKLQLWLHHMIHVYSGSNMILGHVLNITYLKYSFQTRKWSGT